MVATAVMANAPPRLAGGKVSRMIDCWFGCSPPPKKPWNSRNTISSGRFSEIPHRNEHTVNMPMQIRK